MLGWVEEHIPLKYLVLITLITSNTVFATTVTLDWSTVNWNTSSTSQSYNIDPNNPGSDVKITITPSAGAHASAAVVADPYRGGQENLAITVSGADAATVTVRFDFHYASVSNITLPVTGVELPAGATAPTEITRLFGKSGTSLVAGAFAAPATSTGIDIEGSGLGATLMGQASVLGTNTNARIQMFKDVSAMQFVYGTPNGGSNGPMTLYLGPLMYIAGNPLTAGDPADQGLGGIGTLQQGTDPEPMTIVLLASGLAGIALMHYRRRKTSS